MIRDKRGLSAIIVTLIMILLVIVASGIIWVVIRNVVGEGTEQINVGTACLNVNVEATRVVNTSVPGATEDYDVTLTKSAGRDDIGGVSLIFYNSTGTSSDVVEIPVNIELLATTTVNALGVQIINANKVEVAVYFEDASGKKPCSVSNSFEFSL
jgi:flagellin-like protein